MQRYTDNAELLVDRRLRRNFWRSYLVFVVMGIAFFAFYFFVGGGQ
jgi:hypothetical protein